MKLEEGMFIRTDVGKIGKITKIENENYVLASVGLVCNWTLLTYHIRKFSHNIIDLIEAGDYVNGGLVSDITGEYLRIDGESHNKYYFSKEIKSILTHEVFESEAYKV